MTFVSICFCHILYTWKEMQYIKFHFISHNTVQSTLEFVRNIQVVFIFCSFFFISTLIFYAKTLFNKLSCSPFFLHFIRFFEPKVMYLCLSYSFNCVNSEYKSFFPFFAVLHLENKKENSRATFGWYNSIRLMKNKNLKKNKTKCWKLNRQQQNNKKNSIS